MRQLSHIIARNSLAGLAGQFFLKFLSFLFTIAVVRQLGDHQYGLYATVAAFISIVSVFADGGMTGYAIREIAKHHDYAAAVFGNMVLLRIILSTLALFGNLGLAWALGYTPEVIGLIAIASCGVLLTAVSGPLQVVLQGFERLDYDTFCTVFNQGVVIALGALVLWFGWGVPGLLIAGNCAIILTGVVGWRLARQLTPLQFRITPQTWIPLLRAGLPFATITFATMLSFKVDTVMLSLWRSPAEVGWYSVAYNLIFVLMGLLAAFNNALVPSLSRHARSDPGSIEQFYAYAVRLIWTLALPIAVGGALLANRLVVLLYGTQYASAGPILQILIWLLPVLALTSLCGAITTVLHFEQATARINIINATFNIALNLWAIPRYGLIGAAVVTIATEILCFCQYMLLLRGTFSLRSIAYTLRAATIAVVPMSIVLLVAWHLPLALSITAGAISYGLFLLLGGGVSLAEAKTMASVIATPFVRRHLPAAE